jgi:TolA-binding protein
MSDEPLRRAEEALRQFGGEPPDPERAAATRRRALASMERASTRSWRAFGLALALILGGGAAFAQLGGLAELGTLASGWFGGAGPVARQHAEPQRPAVPALRSDSASGAESVSGSDSDSDSVSAAASAPRTHPQRARLAPPNATRAETDLYRRAHTLHFAADSASAALDAWDAYLHAYPKGMFAPEARYNRAIALVRLEHWSEALQALAPFACRPTGSYRSAEARELVARIRRRAPELPVGTCAKVERPQ